jgi:hypothetical protein
MACAWKTVMQFLDIYSRDGGSAAQTGSAAHKAVHAFHIRKEVDAAISAMKKCRAEFPLADFAEAERLFRLYAEDSRNATAKVVHAEFLLHGEIAPGITLEGTCDQIRQGEREEVWDVKTSRFAGSVIRDQHTYQVCAYAVLASQRLKRPIHPGGIIMVRGYEKGQDKVFYPYDLTLDDAKLLMRAVADRVRDVRAAGRIHATPGEHCGYCIGTHACLAKLHTLQHERFP